MLVIWLSSHLSLVIAGSSPKPILAHFKNLYKKATFL